MSEEEKITTKYQVLEKPDFKSAIPSHLTTKLSDQEKYLVETLSRMEQQTSWLVTNMLTMNKAVVEVDSEVQKLFVFKRMLLSKWSVVFWIITVTVPVLLKTGFDWVAKNIR